MDRLIKIERGLARARNELSFARLERRGVRPAMALVRQYEELLKEERKCLDI